MQDRDAVAANAPILMLVNLSSYELEIALPEEYADEFPGCGGKADSGKAAVKVVVPVDRANESGAVSSADRRRGSSRSTGTRS